MQIDFHHTVTYVTARLAGFAPKTAGRIGYAAQYVDNATEQGVVKFSNNALYSRVCSAHEMVDYRNFSELANHHTWIPFHFLPGNGGKPTGENPDGKFVEKLICRPNSPVAQDIVAACIADQDRPHGLHRLGITLHVLADTFAHQGFAGINHRINEVKKIQKTEDPEDTGLARRIKNYFGDKFDEVTSAVLGDAAPLGHGPALTFPDQPYLKWRYENGLGQSILRDNTRIFMEAVTAMHRAMIQYQKKDPGYTLTQADEISRQDLQQIQTHFESFNQEEGEERHAQWIDAIARGDFSFAPEGETVSYDPGGESSWKYLALGPNHIKETEFEFSPEFLASDWKLFHDALQIYRMDVLRNILPRYGICAA